MKSKKWRKKKKCKKKKKLKKTWKKVNEQSTEVETPRTVERSA